MNTLKKDETIENKSSYHNYKKIGRKTLFRFILFSVLVIFLLPVPIGFIIQIFGDNGSITNFYKNMFSEINLELLFVVIQVVVIALGIWNFGPIASNLILEKNKKLFSTGFITVLSLWLLLFLSSTLTAGISNSFEYGFNGFLTAIEYWFIFGLIPYLIFGALHGLLIGYLIGKRIKTLGEKTNRTKIIIDNRSI